MAKKKDTETTVTTTVAVKDFYPKHLVIRAIRWATGMSELDARQAYRDTCAQFHNRTAMEYNLYSNVRKNVRWA